jgi:hypothetical protein
VDRIRSHRFDPKEIVMKLTPGLFVLAFLTLARPSVAWPPVQDSGREAIPAADAQSRSKPWIADAMQLDDAKKRDAAIERIRAAIASQDAVEAHAGLLAFNQVRPVAFDKKPFRAIILPHLAAKDPWMLLAALYALDGAGREDGDLERVLTAVEGVKGRERFQFVHLIALYNGNDLTGKAGEAVLKLIASDERGDVRQSLSGLWGAKVSPAIEKRLLDLANGKNPENAHDAIYFGLSTLQDKSEAVIDRLVAALADPDVNNSGRALWGLGQGVPPSLEPRVADAMVQLFEARADPHTRADALRLLQRYGVERHAKALDETAQKPAISPELAAQVRDAAGAIRKRTAFAPK